MAKVSICVPAYGNEAGIRRLLGSIAQQDYTDYEVILTDDSPDDSVRRAAESCGISGLRYYKNGERMGATRNWNRAVSLASGEYIKIMHHDDWFTDRYSLGRFVKMLDEKPEAIIAFCGTWQVTLSEEKEETDDRFARCISAEHETWIREDWRNLYLGDYIGAPSATIYRRCGLDYEEKLTWLVDVEYYMRLLQKQPCYAYTTEPLICIGISRDQLTESCKADGKLNIFEYGFLMDEFDLSGYAQYRKKFIDIALKYKMPYASIEGYGIPKQEYRREAWKKRRQDFVFLLGVARRKLLGNQKKPC
ncbi:MAG: glycosyltransferase family 2 protein [Eubacteriales bacterium]|nr:glycosyltransferase family 2 protein [Eubacteriales bacterium]